MLTVRARWQLCTSQCLQHTGAPSGFHAVPFVFAFFWQQAILLSQMLLITYAVPEASLSLCTEIYLALCSGKERTGNLVANHAGKASRGSETQNAEVNASLI